MDAARPDAQLLTDAGSDAPTALDLGTDTNCVPFAYYADCDNDGYAAVGAVIVLACTTPTTPPPCGVGTWTLTAPTPGMIDCADMQHNAHPGSTNPSADPAWTAAGVNHYDWNCDGIESAQLTTHDQPITCIAIEYCPPFYNCGLPSDDNVSWAGSVPGCGMTGQLLTCGGQVTDSHNCVVMRLSERQMCL